MNNEEDSNFLRPRDAQKSFQKSNMLTIRKKATMYLNGCSQEFSEVQVMLKMRKETTMYLNRRCQTPKDARTHGGDEAQLFEQLQVQRRQW